MKRASPINPAPDGTLNPNDSDVLIPEGLRPLIDVWMRDPRVTLGHDGAYHLTGTTRDEASGEINARRWSAGIRLWRSENLRDSEPLGRVWSIEDEGGILADYPVYENGVGKTCSPEAFQQHVLPRLRS